MRTLFAALFALLVPLGGLAAGLETFAALTPNPSALASFDEGFAVLDAKNSLLLLSNSRGGLEPHDLKERPLALGTGEKGQGVVITGQSGGELKAHFILPGRKARVVRLKPQEPLETPSDVASMNEIIWVLVQKPPMVALFGGDGAELGRTDLSAVARAPFSLALVQSGGAFVTDPLGPGIIELNSFGQFVAHHRLQETGFTHPSGIAAGGDGRLWVSDTVIGEVASFGLFNKLLLKDAASAFAVDDPVRLARSGSKLLILSGWGARISRAALK